MSTISPQNDRPTGARRQLILDFIEAYLLERGYSPSINEILKASGLSSTNSVEYHIQRLIKDGALVCERYRTRALIPARLVGQIV